VGAGLFSKLFSQNFVFSSAKFLLKKRRKKLLHACALVGWCTICVPTNPPILTFHQVYRGSTWTLLKQTPGQSTGEVHEHYWNKPLDKPLDIAKCYSSRRFVTPCSFPFQVFIQVHSGLNKFKIGWKLWKRWIHSWFSKVSKFYFLCKYLLPLELT